MGSEMCIRDSDTACADSAGGEAASCHFRVEPSYRATIAACRAAHSTAAEQRSDLSTPRFGLQHWVFKHASDRCGEGVGATFSFIDAVGKRLFGISGHVADRAGA